MQNVVHGSAIDSLALRVNAIPRWSGLNHFSSVLKQDFADGRKYEDISKV